MLVVEIDRVDAESFEGGITGVTDVAGFPIDPLPGAVLVALIAELRGDDDTVTPAGQRFADQLLVKGPYMSAVSKKSIPSSSAR